MKLSIIQIIVNNVRRADQYTIFQIGGVEYENKVMNLLNTNWAKRPQVADESIDFYHACK